MTCIDKDPLLQCYRTRLKHEIPLIQRDFGGTETVYSYFTKSIFLVSEKPVEVLSV